MNRNPEESVGEIEYTESDAKEDFEILKSTVVNDENIDMIQKKLVLTQNYRTQIMSNMKTDLKESFPYFFVRSELVSSFSTHYFAVSL